jgi:hypothetical protein
MLQYIFVLSVLPARNRDFVVHLVRKTTEMEIVGFCLVTGDESYTSAQVKIERLILDEITVA